MVSTPNVRYEPRGACRDLLESQAPEIVISGPAGTGKSVACLYKLHWIATKVPKLRALIVRKTRSSLTESALVTYEEKVLPPRHPALLGPRRNCRQAYHYPNGSTIVCGGLGSSDEASRTLSTEYDLVYVQEAIELTEHEWEMLTRPLRNGVLSYQQLLADTNPDSPRHWLKLRANAAKTRMLESRHEENPVLFDAAAGQWTDFGKTYLARLDALTGPRYHRLRHGRWVQAEGVVYEGWDPAVHLIDRFPIPAGWPRILSVDFGWNNPFVAQWWAIDPDGRVYLYREIYLSRCLVEDHARRIVELSKGEPIPAAIVCDHDAEGRATLERYLGRETVPAIKPIQAGIQGVAARLRKAGDGKPRLLVLRDSLDQCDPYLRDLKRPCSTVEEFDSYVWDMRANRKKGEVPVDENNHGMDAMRYLVWGLDCEQAEPEREDVDYTVFQT